MTDIEQTQELRNRGARCARRRRCYEIKRVIVGQDAMLERLLVSLLAGGHVLLEGVPGLAKTLTVKTLAAVLGGTYGRIQFTPDLVPGRPRRHARVPARHAAASTPSSARCSLQLPARRRDQPRARQGAVGAARGDAGAAGDDRRHHVPGAAAVHRDGDPEPDRVRGHLSAPRGAGRPLPDEDPRRLPERPARRPPWSAAASAQPAVVRECLSLDDLRPLRARHATRCSSTARRSATRSRSPTPPATRPSTASPRSPT